MLSCIHNFMLIIMVFSLQIVDAIMYQEDWLMESFGISENTYITLNRSMLFIGFYHSHSNLF